MRKAGLLLLLLVLTSLFLFSQGPPAIVEIVLDTSQSPPEIIVNPDRVEIDLNGSIRWETRSDVGGAVLIDFEQARGQRGPFPPQGTPENAVRGRYRQRANTPITTRGASEAGEWKYEIVFLTPDGVRHELDPIVVVRGG